MEQTIGDIKNILKIIKKRWILIISIFVGLVAIAVVVSFLIPPTYEAETTLRIKQPKGLADSLLQDLPAGSNNNTKQLMSTYAGIIKSRTVIDKVIDKTQGDQQVMPTYEQMVSRITTLPEKESELLTIKIRAKSPEEAQLVANTLIDTFNERMTLLVRSEQSTVRQFIGERMLDSKKELETAETVLQKYKTDEKIAAPTEETKAIVDSLAMINKVSAENKVALAAAQAKVGSADDQLGKEKPGFVADSPLIQQYKGKLAELEVQLVTLSQKYTDKHPEVMATRAAIEETKDKLSTEATRVVNADSPSTNPVHVALLKGKIQAEAEVAAGSAQQVAIGSVVAESEKELNKLPAKEQGLARVMRDAMVAQEIYVMLAKRHEEARISEVMQPTDVQVIDVAVAPIKPISPNKTLNVLIAGILGLCIGLGLAFILEYMNKTVKTIEDVKNYLDLPVLGSIPHFDSNTELPEQNGLWAKCKRMVRGKTKGGT